MPASLGPRSLDLNLLIAFATIYECGSITRAAERLSLSQSATSHALSRLRDACADDLFVRVGQGIVPTAVARRIYPDIRRSLDVLRQAVSEARGFDPATSTRHFHIAIPHPMGPLWGLALREAASHAAPGVTLVFDTRTLPIEPQERMRAGDLDLCIDWLPTTNDRFVNRKLFEDALVCIASGNHPRALPAMDRAGFRVERFVRVQPRPDGSCEAIQSSLQALLEMHLDWAMTVSEYLEVPYVVMQTDLLGFIPKTLFRPGLDVGGLRIVQSPLREIPIPIYAIWHETRRADDGHRWLREFVAARVPG